MAPRAKKDGPPISTAGDAITVAWPVEQLRPNPDNPRFIRDDRFEDLLHAMTTDPAMLDARPLLALPDGTVIGGNMRLRAAIHLNRETVPTQFWDLDEPTQRQWMLRDNNGFGEWQEDAVAELIYNMSQADEDLRGTGFSSGELDALMESVGAVEPPAEFPATDPEPDYRCPKCGYSWKGDPAPSRGATEEEEEGGE